MNKILIIIVIIIFIYLVGSVVYLFSDIGKWFYHDILEWHKPTEDKSFKGYNFCSKCKYCGKDIMQDSQGNWF